MHAAAKALDRRVDRTVTSLRKALTDLIREKHYDSITVQDIIDRANVGRSTFYTHFRDKEDVLVGDWTQFLDHLVEYMDLSKAGTGRFVPIRELMTHLKEYHSLYRGLVRSGKAERLFALGVEHLATGIEAKITEGGSASVPPAMTAHFIALNIFGLLKWWLDRNMAYTPEEMDEMFHTLVAPGIVDALRSVETADVKTPATPADCHQMLHRYERVGEGE